MMPEAAISASLRTACGGSSVQCRSIRSKTRLLGGTRPVNFLHQELDVGPEDVVEVTLDGQANVMLLDSANYEHYRKGEAFRYHGGLAKTSPTRLVPPDRGQWHVVVDLGGFTGKIRAGVRVLDAAQVAS